MRVLRRRLRRLRLAWLGPRLSFAELRLHIRVERAIADLARTIFPD
jgi:hypothetical protein